MSNQNAYRCLVAVDVELEVRRGLKRANARYLEEEEWIGRMEASPDDGISAGDLISDAWPPS